MKLEKESITNFGTVITGKTPPTKNRSYFDGDYLFVTPTDLEYKNYYCRKTANTVTDEAKVKFKNQFIPKDSIMFTCIGNTIGKCAISSDVCLTNQQINSIIPNETHDTKYIYYLLNNNIDYIKVLGGGSATPIINKTKFESVEFQIPSLPFQKTIGGLLSQYDDLIENNLRRIELLEESAQLLFREWFVHLRFPGHEHTKIINGVPEGWEKRGLKELCEIVDYGYTASAQQEEVGPRFLRITDIVPNVIDWSTVPYCELPENRKEKYRLRKGDIVVARTGATVGYAKRINKRSPESVFASYLVRFRFKPEIDNLAIGIFMESDDYKNYVKSHVGGAAQPNANAQILSGARVLIPDKKIRDLFKSIIEPVYDQKEILQNMNETLKKARDILLPRLMNGGIAV